MKPAKQSDGLQWDIGGWYGGQLGGTTWMFVIGISCFSFSQPIAGVLILAIGLLVNIIGFAFFLNEHRLPAYPTLQLFIAILAIATLLIFIILEIANIPLACKLGNYQSPSTPFNHYWVLLMFPALMILFYAQNKRLQKKQSAEAK